jgi:hypothetical protein
MRLLHSATSKRLKAYTILSDLLINWRKGAAMAFEFDPNDPFRNPAMESLIEDIKKLAERSPHPRERKLFREFLKMALLAQAEFEDGIQDMLSQEPPPYGDLPVWRDDDLLDALDDDAPPESPDDA